MAKQAGSDWGSKTSGGGMAGKIMPSNPKVTRETKLNVAKVEIAKASKPKIMPAAVKTTQGTYKVSKTATGDIKLTHTETGEKLKLPKNTEISVKNIKQARAQAWINKNK